MIYHKTDHPIEEYLILPATRYISRSQERSKSQSRESLIKRDNNKKEKDRRSNSKVRFSDKKKPRKSRAYIAGEESSDSKEEYDNIYINSDDDKITYYISTEQP